VNPSDADVTHGEYVEKTLREFIAKRMQERQREEGQRPKEPPWMPVARERDKDKETARLYHELAHARGMLESHTRTFDAFRNRYERRIAYLEDVLGVDAA
jgi:hypothetical protein